SRPGASGGENGGLVSPPAHRRRTLIDDRTPQVRSSMGKALKSNPLSPPPSPLMTELLFGHQSCHPTRCRPLRPRHKGRPYGTVPRICPYDFGANGGGGCAAALVCKASITTSP